MAPAPRRGILCACFPFLGTRGDEGPCTRPGNVAHTEGRPSSVAEVTAGSQLRSRTGSEPSAYAPASTSVDHAAATSPLHTQHSLNKPESQRSTAHGSLQALGATATGSSTASYELGLVMNPFMNISAHPAGMQGMRTDGRASSDADFGQRHGVKLSQVLEQGQALHVQAARMSGHAHADAATETKGMRGQGLGMDPAGQAAGPVRVRMHSAPLQPGPVNIPSIALPLIKRYSAHAAMDGIDPTAPELRTWAPAISSWLLAHQTAFATQAPGGTYFPTYTQHTRPVEAAAPAHASILRHGSGPPELEQANKLAAVLDAWVLGQAPSAARRQRRHSTGTVPSWAMPAVHEGGEWPPAHLPPTAISHPTATLRGAVSLNNEASKQSLRGMVSAGELASPARGLQPRVSQPRTNSSANDRSAPSSSRSIPAPSEPQSSHAAQALASPPIAHAARTSGGVRSERSSGTVPLTVTSPTSRPTCGKVRPVSASTAATAVHAITSAHGATATAAADSGAHMLALGFLAAARHLPPAPHTALGQGSNVMQQLLQQPAYRANAESASATMQPGTDAAAGSARRSSCCSFEDVSRTIYSSPLWGMAAVPATWRAAAAGANRPTPSTRHSSSGVAPGAVANARPPASSTRATVVGGRGGGPLISTGGPSAANGPPTSPGPLSSQTPSNSANTSGLLSPSDPGSLKSPVSHLSSPHAKLFGGIIYTRIDSADLPSLSQIDTKMTHLS